MAEATVAKPPATKTRDPLRFAEVVNWLDSARWANARDLISNRIYETLEPADRMLVHWLCYVTDRVRPFRPVWEDGGFVFSSIVADYSAALGMSLTVRQFLEERQTRGKGKLPAYYAADGDKEVAYAPRFGADARSIERTLTILEDYDRSVEAFISHFISRFRDDPLGLRRLAHCLDLLTYRLEVAIEETRSLLDSEDKLSTHFEKWNERSTEGHKRLWAALRDYRKAGSPYRQYLEALLKWPEEGFELDQLELPGDVWNDRFSDRLVEPIARSLGLKMTRTKGSQAARQLYERILDLDPDTAFYPERLDFSFDFAPRMCDLEMCDVCLLAEAPKLPCLGEMGEEEGKFCPVVLYSCGYRHPCGVADCPVAAEISYGLCTGNSSDVLPPRPERGGNRDCRGY